MLIIVKHDNFFLSKLPLPFDDELFDVVTFLEVIEHCDDIQNNKITSLYMTVSSSRSTITLSEVSIFSVIYFLLL